MHLSLRLILSLKTIFFRFFMFSEHNLIRKNHHPAKRISVLKIHFAQIQSHVRTRLFFRFFFKEINLQFNNLSNDAKSVSSNRYQRTDFKIYLFSVWMSKLHLDFLDKLAFVFFFRKCTENTYFMINFLLFIIQSCDPFTEFSLL